MDETEMSDSLGEGKKLGSSNSHPPKKRRTVDLFACPRSNPSHCNSNSNSNSNKNHPTHVASCNGITTATENFSLEETRSRLGSFSDSLSSGSFSGLPAYVVDIPPIPNLDSDHRANGNPDSNASKKTSTPSIRSLLAIRRYISPSLD